ncbi:MAG: hypothetical protein ABIK10_00170 [candidate division WOR-3 bacterium]
MKNKLIFLLFILFLQWLGCQKKPVLAEVNGEKITQEEFIQKLPKGFTSDTVARKYINNLLEQLIIRKLFIKAGRDLGLLNELASILEVDKKKMLISYLYDEVITKNARLTKNEAEYAKKLAKYDARVAVLEIPNESLASCIYYDIKNSQSLDNLIPKYSQFLSPQYPTDRFLPVYEFDKKIRSIILELKENEVSVPTKSSNFYQIVILRTKKAADDPKGLRCRYAQRILEEEKRTQLENEYLSRLTRRIEYNPRGIRVFYKDPELINPDEETIWVAKKDRRKVVYVKTFLPLARRFPKLLDTLMREYAIKREIEEDLLYEDALARGLDKNKEFLEDLKLRTEDLLYEKFYLSEITQKILVTPEEITNYYLSHKEDFPNLTPNDAAETIQRLLLPERRQQRYQAVVDSLKAISNIKINTKLLNKIINNVIKNQNLARPGSSG